MATICDHQIMRTRSTRSARLPASGLRTNPGAVVASATRPSQVVEWLNSQASQPIGDALQPCADQRDRIADRVDLGNCAPPSARSAFSNPPIGATTPQLTGPLTSRPLRFAHNESKVILAQFTISWGPAIPLQRDVEAPDRAMRRTRGCFVRAGPTHVRPDFPIIDGFGGIGGIVPAARPPGRKVDDEAGLDCRRRYWWFWPRRASVIRAWSPMKRCRRPGRHAGRPPAGPGGRRRRRIHPTPVQFDAVGTVQTIASVAVKSRVDGQITGSSSRTARR